MPVSGPTSCCSDPGFSTSLVNFVSPLLPLILPDNSEENSRINFGPRIVHISRPYEARTSELLLQTVDLQRRKARRDRLTVRYITQ
jgi:hypothetical protein